MDEQPPDEGEADPTGTRPKERSHAVTMGGDHQTPRPSAAERLADRQSGRRHNLAQSPAVAAAPRPSNVDTSAQASGSPLTPQAMSASERLAQRGRRGFRPVLLLDSWYALSSSLAFLFVGVLLLVLSGQHEGVCADSLCASGGGETVVGWVLIAAGALSGVFVVGRFAKRRTR